MASRLPRRAASAFGLLMIGNLHAAIPAMPRLNAGLQTYGSPASGLPTLVDGKYKTASWSISAGSWAAWKLPSAPGKVALAWNNPSYTWSDWVTNASNCKQGANLTFPADYEILTSSNSTDGTDGDWTSRLKVTGNKVSSRMHIVQTGADVWVKMAIQAGTGSLDEIEIHDASVSTEDTWAFIGTSITSGAFKSDFPAVGDFQSWMSQSSANGNWPLVVRAGIPCIVSTDVSSNIGRYLEMLDGVKNWAIEMGTNDAWGGGTGNVASFKAAMQLVIDSAKGRGVRVFLARTPATNSTLTDGKWQVNPAFLTAIDDLVRTNGLVEGADLNAYFTKYPSDLSSDGVHPNAKGYAAIHNQWANALLLRSVYAPMSSVDKIRRGADLRFVSDRAGTRLRIDGAQGPLWLVSIDGAKRKIGVDGQGWIPREWGLTGVQFVQTQGQVRAVFVGR
ncbi:MAG: SGNH/GDSL hydrolase family protein [Fibrobacterota bacterium]|nr:SGNH/GDSL hydrolase family protein [Fibrobacterota bacterium]QQS05879.1 MAG: SGNH/GDSL hydrolase family protein [Fibrobacterota bacterium]